MIVNDDLNVLSLITKHMEHSEIELRFSNNFKLENITHKVLVDMYDNIENRLLWIDSNEYFVVIRRSFDNKILKSEITY